MVGNTSRTCILICLSCVLWISAGENHHFSSIHNVESSHGEGNKSPTFRVFTTEKSKSGENTVTPGGTVPRRRLKILVHNPRMGWSHSQFLGAVADTLVDAGHEVHVLSYSMNTQIGNYTGTTKTHRFIWHERPVEKWNSIMENSVWGTNPFEGPTNGMWSGMLKQCLQAHADVCKEILANKALLAYLRAERYDFGLSEVYNACPFGIFKLAGVKATASANAVTANSMITAIYGIPSFSSFVYDILVSVSTNPLKMSFLERATNFFFDVYAHFFVIGEVDNTVQKVFNEALGAASPSLRDVMKNVSLAFVNSKEFFALPRPISHKIVYIGGIAVKGQKKTNALSERFASLIDAAPKGAVLFSFGTVADTKLMTTALKRTFADAFAKFSDYAFIWKLNLAVNETLALPPNVHIVDWVPQAQILEHPRTRLFISHCGLNSANEAAAVGVPVLGLPLFGDQPYNAATIINKGFGLALDISDIARSGGSAALEAALHSLLNDGAHFAENARLVARKLALTPFSARERLIKWVEFAAEFENLNELNMPTEDELGLLAYYSVDVMAVALLALSLAGYMAVKVLAFASRHLSRQLKQKTL